MCLNEIVNATEKFVSRYPHLVVAQLEWIQTRYLFVKCSNRTGTTSEEPNILLKFLPQDPFFFVQGDDGSCLGIPSSAMRTSNRFRLSQGSMAKAFMNNNKRRRLTGKEGPTEVGALTNDGASVDTDIEDIELLFSDNDDRMRAARNRKGRLKATVSYLQPTQTGFVPGILDHSSLPILGPPAYATSTATNAIQRELRKILKLQETQPLHELGWYIDPEHIENVYQWVMELHSFDLTLPLSLDLLKAGTNSVVLEVRFGKEFPTSPPFVRVIRPRFLNYSRGGGGHVTSGGAMCMEVCYYSRNLLRFGLVWPLAQITTIP
jgi:ubiquitin-conjugating enzyme E2 Q